MKMFSPDVFPFGMNPTLLAKAQECIVAENHRTIKIGRDSSKIPLVLLSMIPEMIPSGIIILFQRDL